MHPKGVFGFLSTKWMLILFSLHSSRAVENPPNVVIFLADDVGYGDLSCYGNPQMTYGAIDELARDGMRFTNAYVPDSRGVASRGALLTGRYPVRLGLYGNKERSFTPTHSTGLPKEETTIAEALKDHGYKTGIVGKWHLGINEKTNTDGSHLPHNHGFDYVGTILPLTNGWNCRNSSTEQLPDPDSCFLYKGSELKEQPFQQEELTAKFVQNAKEFIQSAGNENFFLLFSFAQTHVNLFASERFKDSSNLGRYGDSVNEMSWAVQEVVEELTIQGIDDDTLVIFLSDNGPFLEMCAEGGYGSPLRGGKGTTFEGGVRIPFIVKWPGKITSGAIQRHLVSSMDIVPTILDIVGWNKADKPLDGKSVTDVLLEDRSDAYDDMGFEAASSVADPHEEGLFFYCGMTLMSMRFEDYKIHFYNSTEITRQQFGTNCKPGGNPSEEYYRECSECSCMQTLDVPEVYLISQDPGESRPIMNYTLINDAGFKNKMESLLSAHQATVTAYKTALLSDQYKNPDLQPGSDGPFISSNIWMTLWVIITGFHVKHLLG